MADAAATLPIAVDLLITIGPYTYVFPIIYHHLPETTRMFFENIISTTHPFIVVFRVYRVEPPIVQPLHPNAPPYDDLSDISDEFTIVDETN